jgi:hypothetical protein
MTTEQNNTNKQQQQPSRGLFDLLLELKITISELKELYKKIDKKALEEGFSIDEIYGLANITDMPVKSSVVGAEPTTTPSNQTTSTKGATKTNTTNPTINNNTKNNTKNKENEETNTFNVTFNIFNNTKNI